MDNQLALDINGIITTARLIDEAEGLAFLGLHTDAWEVLETLPPADRVRPAVLAVLLVCHGLAHWELGQEIARYIGPVWETEQEAAAVIAKFTASLAGALFYFEAVEVGTSIQSGGPMKRNRGHFRGVDGFTVPEPPPRINPVTGRPYD
jgi:hypothetical protein